MVQTHRKAETDNLKTLHTHSILTVICHICTPLL